MPDSTRPSSETRAEEAKEAKLPIDAGRPPTPEEERAADEQSVSPGTAAAEKDMVERGARQQGEGRLP